jgi:general secretion pathway protein G
MRRAFKGFTLIELIVVIAIIAVLAAVVAPNAFKAIEKAKISGTMSDLSAIKTGAMAFYGDTGQWPANNTTGAGLVTNVTLAGWDGPYLEKWPGQSKWGGAYTFMNNSAVNWGGPSAAGDAGRYVQVTSVPNNSMAKIDSQVDGTGNTTAGSVRYTTDNPLQYLISTDVSVD